MRTDSSRGTGVPSTRAALAWRMVTSGACVESLRMLAEPFSTVPPASSHINWQARLEAQEKALAESVAAARDRVAAKQAQLDAIAQITDRVTPFLHLLRARLAQRIEQDLPFLTAERQQRLARLDALLDDPAVAVSEKLRKVFEALLVEAEYGNTIEVYQETVTVDSQPLLADIFRLGRLGLYYQRLDRQAGGFYNVARDTWEPLDKAANRALTTAIAIGTKRQPVEILDMPLGRLAQP